MGLREALRMLRSELGMTQAELANAVHVGYTAASRWENKDSRPNRASSAAILELAKKRCVSPICLDGLTEILLASRANDKAEKELTAQVTEQLMLEERILLTDDRMKTMLDNLDLAVIGHRVFSTSPDNTTIIYSNRKYAEIFGYPPEEFEIKSKKNVYFSIPKESREKYKKLVKRLLAGDMAITDFSQVLSGFRRDGTTVWLEVKGISLEHLSYGWEFFISCRDVSQRVEAERKYAEEIAIRDATLSGLYASMHFDLVNNTIFRQRDIEKVTGEKFSGQNVDLMLKRLADGIIPNDRKEFLEKFNREHLSKAFVENNLFDNIICFNTVCGKWMRFAYVLIKNPYTHHIEAVIYVYDANAQMIATKMMNIIGECYFDYIGIINNKTEAFELFYYSPTVSKSNMDGERDYREVCAENLDKYAPEQVRETQRNAISIETIRKKLDKSVLYTTELLLNNYDKASFKVKVTYSYLDETRATIVIAQHKTAI